MDERPLSVQLKDPATKAEMTCLEFTVKRLTQRVADLELLLIDALKRITELEDK